MFTYLLRIDEVSTKTKCVTKLEFYFFFYLFQMYTKLANVWPLRWLNGTVNTHTHTQQNKHILNHHHVFRAKLSKWEGENSHVGSVWLWFWLLFFSVVIRWLRSISIDWTEYLHLSDEFFRNVFDVRSAVDLHAIKFIV